MGGGVCEGRGSGAPYTRATARIGRRKRWDQPHRFRHRRRKPARRCRMLRMWRLAQERCSHTRRWSRREREEQEPEGQRHRPRARAQRTGYRNRHPRCFQRWPARWDPVDGGKKEKACVCIRIFVCERETRTQRECAKGWMNDATRTRGSGERERLFFFFSFNFLLGTSANSGGRRDTRPREMCTVKNSRCAHGTVVNLANRERKHSWRTWG